MEDAWKAMATASRRQRMAYRLIKERDKLREALVKIDEIGNGLSADDKNLTAYASLVRCGSIARAALNNNAD